MNCNYLVETFRTFAQIIPTTSTTVIRIYIMACVLAVAGADVNSANLYNILVYTLYCGHVLCVNVLAATGADVNMA